MTLEWRRYEHLVDSAEDLRPTTFECENCGEPVTAIPDRSVSCSGCNATHEIRLRTERDR